MTAPPTHADRLVGHAVIDGTDLGLDARRYYRISSYDRMPSFLMTIVGASDLWMFISSTGGLSAGRGHADRAIFPYYTEDKLSEGAEHTGGLTVLRVHAPDGTVTWWRPFDRVRPGDSSRTGASTRTSSGRPWSSRRPGPTSACASAWCGRRARATAWSGRVRSTSLAEETVEVEVLDGLRNLLPAGVTAQTQNELSVLLDAYKRSELDLSPGWASTT